MSLWAHDQTLILPLLSPEIGQAQSKPQELWKKGPLLGAESEATAPVGSHRSCVTLSLRLVFSIPLFVLWTQNNLV